MAGTRSHVGMYAVGLVTTLVAWHPAIARKPVVGAYVDNVTESPDGGSLANKTTISLIGGSTLAGWKLTADVAYRAVRGSTPSLAEQQRSGQLTLENQRKSFYELYGLTDTRVSAERSVPLPGKVSLDLLARLTLPSGQRGVDRARGRYEMMLDAGLRTRLVGADIWAGAAHRFRTEGFYVPGRDINEIYAGASRPVAEQTTLRLDYLRAQSPFIGSAQEHSISLGITHTMNSGIAFDFYSSRYNDAYGKGGQAGLSLRMPTKAF